MKPTVYVETTIPSYLTAWPSRDLIRAAHQQLTREWWGGREAFSLFVSQAVLDEAGRGDPDAAARRLVSLQDVPVLETTLDAIGLAEALVAGVPLPAKASIDALHVAIAATNGIDYLLTWNCTHIANAMLRNRIEHVCRSLGYEPPVICMPDALTGDEP